MEAISKRNQTLIFTVVLVLMGTAVLVSIVSGRYPITVQEIMDIMTGSPVKELTRQVFLTLRLPRTLMALIAGMALGISGAVFQLIFKNPLATPDLIGVASGANLGAAIAIVFLGSSLLMLSFSAFIGGLVTVLFVIALAAVSNRRDAATYVLAGIAINALVNAQIMMMKYFADTEKELESIEFWSMGSLKNITNDKVAVILPIFLIGLLGIILLRRQIMLLSLSDDESRMLGVRLNPVRCGVLGSATLMVASVISVTGLISFVGLVGPHLSRMTLRKNSFSMCLMSGMIGSLILLISDSVARSISSAEIPISILTSLLGVPFLVYYIGSRRQKI